MLCAVSGLKQKRMGFKTCLYMAGVVYHTNIRKAGGKKSIIDENFASGSLISSVVNVFPDTTRRQKIQ